MHGKDYLKNTLHMSLDMLFQFVALELGCETLTEAEVIGCHWNEAKSLWKVEARYGAENWDFWAKSVINCTGNEVNQMNGGTEHIWLDFFEIHFFVFFFMLQGYVSPRHGGVVYICM
jgi:hypothetical protein